MALGKKYAAFAEWLRNCGKDSVSMSFLEMNKIIDLPEYAYNHRPAWANHSEPMSFSSCWLSAGYHVEKVDLQSQKVLFKKTKNIAEKKEEKQDYPISHKADIDLNELLQCGAHFIDKVITIPNHRYKSWEHCYKAFKGQHMPLTDAQIDYLTLHLAFYLASWGMYRGSSFLFQRDYKIHKPAVELLLDPQWSNLRDISGLGLSNLQNAEKIIQLSERLTKTYERWASGTPTDTLLTKIMLGTLGCTPAYDIYLKTALKAAGIAEPKFTVSSLQSLGQFYQSYQRELTELQTSCSTTDVVYPPVKILDMCLFEFGLAHAPKQADDPE